MPSVIDELVIKIAFDIEGLKKRGGETNEQLKKIQDLAEQTGKRMEESGKRAAGFFASAKVEAIALMSVLTGGAGLITAAAATASSIADLGRAAQNLNGMNPQALDAWGQALKRIGGDAQNAITSFNNVGSALARYRLKGDTAIIPYLNAIGAQTTQTPEQIALRFSAYIKEHPEKTAQEINVIGQGLGMTQDMTNLLRQGPDVVRRELDLSRQLGLRTQAMIETASQFQHDFEALNQAARNLKDRMMLQMMPTMDKFMVALTDWITKNPNGAEAAAIGGTVLGGSMGASVIARMLGLTALADAFSGLTALILRLNIALGWLAFLGPAGGQATTEETTEITKRLQREGKLAPGELKPLPGNYLDPNGGPSIWGWVKNKMGWGSDTPPATTSTAGPRVGSYIGAAAAAAGQSSFAFWKSKGLSDAAAAGMAAQEVQESGGNPGARGDYVNGQATAHGAYQWHADRRAQILAATGIDVSTNMSIEKQREAAYWEYTHTERATQQAMQGVTDPTQAGRVGTGFERPGLTEADKERERVTRGNKAAEIARRAQNAAPPVGPRALGYTGEPDLLPAPGARGEDTFRPISPVSNSMEIGQIHIHTQAKDSDGIAKEIHGALSDKMIAQANRGLV